MVMGPQLVILLPSVILRYTGTFLLFRLSSLPPLQVVMDHHQVLQLQGDLLGQSMIYPCHPSMGAFLHLQLLSERQMEI